MIKQLPDTEKDNNKLFHLPYEVVKWELIKTALELTIFDLLEKESSPDKLSKELSLNEENTEHLLNALVSIGCLTKRNNQFKNTALTSQYLSSGKDTSLHTFLLSMNDWMSPILNGGMIELVKNGPQRTSRKQENSHWASGARRSLNTNRTGRAQFIADDVKKLPESDKIKKILDLGAGSGIIGVAVVSKLDNSTGVLVDRKEVIEVAEDVIREYGMTERVSTISGDYSKDYIGEGYDLILASQTLNFYRNNLESILSRVFNALNPGGLFYVVTDSLKKEKTMPESMVITWLPTALQGADLSFEDGEVANAMLQVGFQSTETRVMGPIGIDVRGQTDIIIGRKSRI